MFGTRSGHGDKHGDRDLYTYDTRLHVFTAAEGYLVPYNTYGAGGGGHRHVHTRVSEFVC